MQYFADNFISPNQTTASLLISVLLSQLCDMLVHGYIMHAININI